MEPGHLSIKLCPCSGNPQRLAIGICVASLLVGAFQKVAQVEHGVRITVGLKTVELVVKAVADGIQNLVAKICGLMLLGKRAEGGDGPRRHQVR